MANDTEFGLAAYFYSRDIGRIWRVAEALEYGIVGINEGIVSTEIAPFGRNVESRGYAMFCLSAALPPALAMTVAGQNGPKERRAVSARDVR